MSRFLVIVAAGKPDTTNPLVPEGAEWPLSQRGLDDMIAVVESLQGFFDRIGRVSFVVLSSEGRYVLKSAEAIQAFLLNFSAHVDLAAPSELAASADFKTMGSNSAGGVTRLIKSRVDQDAVILVVPRAHVKHLAWNLVRELGLPINPAGFGLDKGDVDYGSGFVLDLVSQTATEIS